MSDLQTVREALEFYAEKSHFALGDPNAWDTVSGEPQNYWCDEAGTATVEDGSVAKQALAALSRLEAAAVPELSREDVLRLTREAADYANAEYPRRQFAKDPITWWQLRDGRFASLVRSVPVGGQS